MSKDGDALPSSQEELFELVAGLVRAGRSLSEWKPIVERDIWLIFYASSQTGITLLHAAARWGRLDALRYLLEHGAPVDKRDMAGHTPLWLACFAGRIDIVRLLLQNRACADVVSSINHLTPLQIAQKRGYFDICSLLVGEESPNLPQVQLEKRPAPPMFHLSEEDMEKKPKKQRVINVSSIDSMMQQMPPLSPLTPFNHQPQPSLESSLPILQTNEECIWNDVIHTWMSEPEMDTSMEKIDLQKLLCFDFDTVQ